MAEPNQAPSPAPEEREKRSANRAKRRQSVFQYISILFAAAFVLMLVTFFMERRENQQTVSDLQGERVSAMQSVQDLIAQNEALQAQVDALQGDLASAQQELDGLKDMVGGLSAMQEQLTRAMDLFWQINEAYVRGRYTLCRELIAQMEDTTQGSALKESLPADSTTDNGRFSPADRYAEIYEALF